MSGMWQQLTEDLGIDLGTSTAHRPQTDGQVERFNKTLEEMLRSYVNNSHNDWDVWLDCAEFAANKAKAAATGFCPFELVYQHTPMSPPERMLENSLNPLTRKDKLLQYFFYKGNPKQFLGSNQGLRASDCWAGSHNNEQTD